MGGTFDSVPLCEQDDQTGCVVSYASFRSTSPPGATSSPATATAQRPRASTRPTWPAAAGAAAFANLDQPEACCWAAPRPSRSPTMLPRRPTTSPRRGVTYQVWSRARASGGGFSYLELTVDADPSDPRTDDIGGDLSPEWGMHLVDANVAMGDIEDLVATQAAAYTG